VNLGRDADVTGGWAEADGELSSFPNFGSVLKLIEPALNQLPAALRK
jgi:hypothetical protein